MTALVRINTLETMKTMDTTQKKKEGINTKLDKRKESAKKNKRIILKCQGLFQFQGGGGIRSSTYRCILYVLTIKLESIFFFGVAAGRGVKKKCTEAQVVDINKKEKKKKKKSNPSSPSLGFYLPKYRCSRNAQQQHPHCRLHINR